MREAWLSWPLPGQRQSEFKSWCPLHNRVVNQEIAKGSEEIEMKLAMRLSAVKNLVSNSLATSTPAKLLGGLALGALLMTVTVPALGTIHADGPSRPAVIEQANQAPEFDEFDHYPVPRIRKGSTLTAAMLEDVMREYTNDPVSRTEGRSVLSATMLEDVMREYTNDPVSRIEGRSALTATMLD